MISLKRTLQANASSCLFFGLLFISMPSLVVQFLSESNTAPVQVCVILGIGLVFHGAHLLWSAQQPKQEASLILYFSICDFLWVLGSLILIVLGIWVTSFAGIIASTIIAGVVGFFGAIQFRYLSDLKD